MGLGQVKEIKEPSEVTVSSRTDGRLTRAYHARRHPSDPTIYQVQEVETFSVYDFSGSVDLIIEKLTAASAGLVEPTIVWTEPYENYEGYHEGNGSYHVAGWREATEQETPHIAKAFAQEQARVERDKERQKKENEKRARTLALKERKEYLRLKKKFEDDTNVT